MIRRIFAAAPLIWAFAVPLRAGPPPSAPPPEFAATTGPAVGESLERLDRFRDGGPQAPYYLEFRLREFPRRGAESDFAGRLWGSRSDMGAVLRLELNPGTPAERRYLLQNGPEASVWLWMPGGGAPRKVDAFEPLLPGLDLTPFDLEMPFLYWPDPETEGIHRMLGRPAELFDFRAPPGAGLGGPGVAAVRAYLDTQYAAPVQIERLAADGRVLSTFSLVDLKMVGDQWMPKDIEARDEASRDKTRFTMVAAALGLSIDPEFFTPNALSGAGVPPPAVSIRRFGL